MAWLKDSFSNIGRYFSPQVQAAEIKPKPAYNFGGMILTNQGTKIIRPGVKSPVNTTNTNQNQQNDGNDVNNVQPQAENLNVNRGGYTSAQNEYLDYLKNPPSYTDLYSKYAEETGYAPVQKLLVDLEGNIADLEGKIGKVETDIGEQTKGFLVTEAARRRLTEAGEYPLRQQYTDLIRSRARLSAEATAKAQLLSTYLGLAKEEYGQKGDYLKALVDLQRKGESSDTSGILNYLLSKETLPTGEQGLSDQEMVGLPTKPLSRQGLEGNIIYTSRAGTQVKWWPTSQKWVKVNQKNQAFLDKMFK